MSSKPGNKQPVDKGHADARLPNSGLTPEQIKARMRHYTRSEKAAERRRRASRANGDAQ
jgi:hypothetical protein